VRFILDTSILLNHVHGDRRTNVLLDRLHDQGAEFYTTDVIVCEALARGTEAELHVIERLLAGLTYAPITADVARAASRLLRDDARLGSTDALLDALSESLDAPMLTHPAGRHARRGSSVILGV